MRIAYPPTEELLKSFNKILSLGRAEHPNFYLNKEASLGVCRKQPFSPIKYLGNATFLLSKLHRKKVYSFNWGKDFYSGSLIKDALKILGKRRVRIFIHRRKGSDRAVLFLGTKEGTVAIASRYIYKGEEKECTPLRKVMRSFSPRFLRKYTFEGVLNGEKKR